MLGEMEEQCRYVVMAATQLDAATAVIRQGDAEYKVLSQQRLEAMGPLRGGSPPDDFAAAWDLMAEYDRQRSALEVRSRQARETVWFSIQNLLTAAANIAKLLWGSDKAESAEQRRPLRELLNVEDTSPLKPRELRNHFEHVDDKIIQQVSAPDAPSIFIARVLGGPASQQLSDPPVPQYHHYDMDTGIASFWHHSVRLPDVTREAARLLPLAESRRLPHG